MKLFTLPGKVISAIFLCLFVIGSNTIMAQVSTLVLDSVSIAPNNRHIVLGWTLQTIATDGFIEIHRQQDNGIYAPIIRLETLTQSTFTDTGTDATIKAYSYYIVARYPNGDPIAVSNEAHKSIFLYKPSFNLCERSVNIRWDGYGVTTSAGQPVPLPIPFDSVNVIITSSGIYPKIFTVGAEAMHEISIPLSYEGVYNIKVQYFNSKTGITSRSNSWYVNVRFAPQPSFLHVRKVTLDYLSENVQLLLHADASISGAGYVVSRYNSGSGLYDVLDTLTNQGQTILFTDSLSSGNLQSEIYQVTVLDECKAVSLLTEPISTIFLANINNSILRNELTWNHYLGWETGVSEYHVLRDLHGNGFELLSIWPGNINNFVDDLSIQEESLFSSEIKYRIRAVESAGNLFGFRDTVYSNILVISQGDGIFIPNAINILSSIEQNRIFKPIFTRGTPKNYYLSVFNRWGQPLFQSNDPEQGWDGRVKGREAPAGVYSYILEYRKGDGILQKKTGVFILIK